jgi:hypothetical protein
VGLNIDQEDNSYFASMIAYISRLEQLPASASFNDFRTLRAKMLWIVNARPDLTAFVSIANSVTDATFAQSDVRRINERVRYLHETKDVRLEYPKLDIETLHMSVYSDASYVTRSDGSSQRGFIVLLVDDTQRCCILHFHSGKTRLVARSSMAAEVLAFADAYDSAFTIRDEITRLLGKNIPLLMYTDSAVLFDAITRHKRTSEGRLMLEIHAARESHRRRKMQIIALIRTQYNSADPR